MKRPTTAAIACLALVSSTGAFALDLQCDITKKLTRDFEYTRDQLADSQFSVRIEDKATGAFLSRCSVPKSSESATCDRYPVDSVHRDEASRITKFYDFSGQFDVQLFPDMTIIENNGRGSIAFGTCRVSEAVE
jgi:hypothetical protein